MNKLKPTLSQSRYQLPQCDDRLTSNSGCRQQHVMINGNIAITLSTFTFHIAVAKRLHSSTVMLTVQKRKGAVGRGPLTSDANLAGMTIVIQFAKKWTSQYQHAVVYWSTILRRQKRAGFADRQAMCWTEVILQQTRDEQVPFLGFPRLSWRAPRHLTL